MTNDKAHDLAGQSVGVWAPRVVQPRQTDN